MTGGSCLCGAVTWTLAGPLSSMFHCHCSRCRKAHGAAFATYLSAPADTVRVDGAVASWRPSPQGDQRAFCPSCGSVVPYVVGDVAFAPAGNLDDDPELRPRFHMFVASRASWYSLRDRLPQYAVYPPGLEATPSPDPPSPDHSPGPGGSCLCGAITYVLTGEPTRRRYCHCGRCRKSLSAAHAANMTAPFDALRFTRGEDQLSRYKVPDARHFTTLFCPTCGSPMPRRDGQRGISIIPLGSFDDDPGIASAGHIFVGSKAPWFEIADDLPRYAEYPPSENPANRQTRSSADR